jgi:hypothetical protein
VTGDGNSLFRSPAVFLVNARFCFVLRYLSHVKWVHCNNGTARPRVADSGDGLQIWRVAANILNKQSRTADSERSYSLGVGRGANNPSP